MTASSNPLWRYPSLVVVMVLFFAFLYIPMVVLVVLSFNQNQTATIWTGFSLEWYKTVLENPNIIRAAQNSLIVASAATIISTIIATMAAVGMAGKQMKGQAAVSGLIGLPLLVPEIVTAVASLLFFLAIGLELSLLTVIIAHVVFCIPFAYLPIRARLEGLDPKLLEAASDLYARPLTAFWRVTFPLLLPGIISGAMLAFITSMDDFVITFFVAGAGATTLPVYIFGMIRTGISPEVNAISTLLFAASLVVVLGSWLVGQKKY